MERGETLVMNISKAIKRDREINRRKSGHRVDNRNIFLLEEEKKKKAEQIKKEREVKEKLILSIGIE